jgi:hypothetical protein
MAEVVGVIVLFLGLFATLITWATRDRAETHNATEEDMS